MDGGEEQNTGSTTNGTPQTGGNSRPPQIAHMSLYERQAVQALQALQRQPQAAQYFQHLMLQQQINNAQLHNLAAVQQATLAASRQSSTPSNSMPQVATTVQSCSCQVNISTTSAGGTMSSPRPHGPATLSVVVLCLFLFILWPLFVSFCLFLCVFPCIVTSHGLMTTSRSKHHKQSLKFFKNKMRVR
uniref:Polyhomeotic homolog 1 n=1 Tax=Amphiprion percula TaxID=161767 RepID=A0A3P8STQ0_AMPPE